MRRFISVTSALVLIWTMSVALSAQKKPTLDDLDGVMKKDGPAQQALVRALTAGNQAMAKTQLATLKAGVTATQEFWSGNKRTDAIEMSKTVLTKIDALEKVVNAPTLDSAAALAAVQDLSTSCNACHKVYRSTDADGHFILKPGSVPGL